MKITDIMLIGERIYETANKSLEWCRICKVAERAGLELFEKRYPIGHKQPNMESNWRQIRDSSKNLARCFSAKEGVNQSEIFLEK